MLKGGTPIVSLDKVYLSDDDAIFLDCTRMSQSSELVSRKRPNRPNDVLIQIADIVYNLKKDMQRKVFLADDVVFSGDVLRKIVELFQQFGIEVVGIKSSIATKNSYEYFNKNLLYGLDVFEHEPLLEDDVIYSIQNMDKVILTPHIAWGSIEARQRCVNEVYENILSFLKGEERNIVNNE